MKVKYLIDDIHKKLKDGLLPNELNFYKRWSVLPSKFHLTYEKKYTVYGIDYTKDGYCNFLLVDDTEVLYPEIYPSEFFMIVDNRISKFWHGELGDYYPIDYIKKPMLITFKEIIEDEYFFDKLLDAEPNAQKLFLTYKKLMDNELPDDEIKTATEIEGKWVSCAYCGEFWENTSSEGIIICPKNHEKNNNPHWVDKVRVPLINPHLPQKR